MLLRPILLHVDKYSEYISDRDTEPSGYVSKCAFSLTKKQTTSDYQEKHDFQILQTPEYKYEKILEIPEAPSVQNILPLQCKLFSIKFHNTRWRLVGLSRDP